MLPSCYGIISITIGIMLQQYVAIAIMFTLFRRTVQALVGVIIQSLWAHNVSTCHQIHPYQKFNSKGY